MKTGAKKEPKPPVLAVNDLQHGCQVLKLKLEDIQFDPGIQTRAGTDSQTVAEYARLMGEGTVFPPIDVFKIGTKLVVADGEHRRQAAVLAKLDVIDATVHDGTIADALTFALKANTTHGRRRTNADKRHAVKVALSAFRDQSNEGIAILCSVSKEFVRRIRNREQVTTDATSSQRVGLDGKTYPVKSKPNRSRARNEEGGQVQAAKALLAMDKEFRRKLNHIVIKFPGALGLLEMRLQGLLTWLREQKAQKHVPATGTSHNYSAPEPPLRTPLEDGKVAALQ